MKTIRCNLTKTSRIFATFTESFYKYVGILPQKISRNFTDLSKNYTLVYITGMFEALSLLVYKSDPHLKGDNSIGLLAFALGLVQV